MATQPERNMTETPPSATGEPGSSGSIEQPRRFITSNFDLNRRDYETRVMGNYVSWVDPQTGAEIARLPKIEGGAGIPSSEVTALLEKTREQESDPHYWMVALQRLHNLPARDREVRKDEYNEACLQLAKFAHDSKLFGNSPELTILEAQLVVFEKRELQRGGRTKEEQESLQDLLDDLTKQENELIRVRNSLRLKSDKPDFFTEDQWRNLEARENQLFNDPEVGINSFRAEITRRTSLDFLSRRDLLKTRIDDATKIVRAEEEDKKQQELSELKDEPDEWVRIQEEGLLIDGEPTLREPPQESFAQALNIFNEQLGMREEGNPGFSLDTFDQVREVLMWYFHRARSLGVSSDLENALNHKYQEWANALISHREINPYDGSSRITQKTFSEVQDEIIEYFSNLSNPEKPQYVEHEARWNLIQRSIRRRGFNFNNADKRLLQGLREELVRRAQIQIEDSLQNVDQQLTGQPFSFTSTDRISGEWNVNKLERAIRENRERQEAQERSKPLFRHESYYSIDLLGTNREEIERGADQAADYIIGSATTFSLEVVRQRMELLTQGIEKKKGTIQASEGVSEDEAKKIALEIQRAITNKLDFFILDWTAANLLMDQFAGYYSDRFRMDGDQKLKVIPAMNDGQVGLTIHWLNNPLYELYHRPQGFQGQLYDDDQTHKFERSLMKEQIIKKLMEYELKGRDYREKTRNRDKLKGCASIHEFLQNFDHKGVIPIGVIPEDLIPMDPGGERNPTKFFNSLSLDQRIDLLNLLSPQQQESLFNNLLSDQRVDIRRRQYQLILLGVKAKEEKGVTFEDLAMVREARKRLAEEQNRYQAIKSRAESAFDTADKVLNIFGEAAFLGAPSFVMENGPEVKGLEGQVIKRGDFISIEDYKRVQKYAILQAGRRLIAEVTDNDGKKYNIDDNLALIKYRSKEWIKRWKAAGLDRSKTDRKFTITIVLPAGKKVQVSVELAVGFEETGLIKQEWQAFLDTDEKFKKDGCNLEIDGVKFEDIKEMDDLEPVLNNFLVDFKSSMTEINDPNVIEKAARGRMIQIADIRKRLGFTGRDRFVGTTQQETNEYTQRVEDSRSFEAELERLAYFAATHNLSQPPVMVERGKPVYKFSEDRIDYGYQRQSWGVKRLHYMKAFWLTNLRRTVPRAVDLLPFGPFTLSSLRREMSFISFMQMCWEVGRMESIDNPSLVSMGERHKAVGLIRSRSEGGINDQEWKKVWGFWEKPLVDANSLWKLMHFISEKTTFESLEKALKDPRGVISLETREAIINHLQEVTFSRFVPILVATEKSLGEDRQALSAGSGYDENEKFALRYLDWLMSNKEGEGREQGGLQVQKEIVDVLRLIVTPNSYREGASIWDEFWRKQTPSHNPRLPDRIPGLTLVAA